MLVAERVGMSLEQFTHESDQQNFELFDGERVEKMASGFLHSETIRLLVKAILAFLQNDEAFIVYSETTFILPNAPLNNWVTDARIPDAMVYERTRWEAWKALTSNRKVAISLVPDWVIEVISPNDTFRDVVKKARLYLRDGVRLVWVLDPEDRHAYIFTPDSDHIQTLDENDMLDASAVIPHFRMTLSAILD
jgi:Uma2 family endonuclease